MFGLFAEKCTCPSCQKEFKSSPSKVRISRFRKLQVVTCPHCSADFLKSKRAELVPVLEEGVLLV